MRRIVIMLALGAVLGAGIPLPGVAADDEGLFDTKAAAAHLEKGIAHLKNKKYDSAIRELEDAASINPDAEAYYYLGYAYYMKGKKGDAESRKKSIESFDRAYELNPGFKPGRFKPAEEKTLPEPKAKESMSPEAPQATTPTTPAESSAATTTQQPHQQTSDQGVPSQPDPAGKGGRQGQK